MSTQVQLRGGTTAEHSVFTGAVREVTVDTTKNTLVVHDGVLVGGYPVVTTAGSYSDPAWIASLAWGKLTGVPSTFAPSTHTHVTGDITGLSEAIDDRVAALLVAGSGISLSYNDGANTLTISSSVPGVIPPGGATGTILRKSSGSDYAVSWSLPRLDELAAPTSPVNFNQQQATAFCIENRTSDPLSPVSGQIWLRTDL